METRDDTRRPNGRLFPGVMPERNYGTEARAALETEKIRDASGTTAQWFVAAYMDRYFPVFILAEEECQDGIGLARRGFCVVRR